MLELGARQKSWRRVVAYCLTLRRALRYQGGVRHRQGVGPFGAQQGKIGVLCSTGATWQDVGVGLKRPMCVTCWPYCACAQDEEFEVQLRAYQQQFEKLKAQYAERAGRLEAATKVRGGWGPVR